MAAVTPLEEGGKMEPTAPNPTEWRAGYLIDLTTGEVLDVEQPTAFAVDSMDAAEWVLQRMSEADADSLALQARMEAIMANLGAMMNAATAKRAWLDRRFGDELRAFAEGQLDGGKARSLKTPWGTLGFRRTAGSTKVLDIDAALAWADRYAPGAIVVKRSVSVSRLPDADLPKDAFEVTAPEDRFYVKTGIPKSAA